MMGYKNYFCFVFLSFVLLGCAKPDFASKTSRDICIGLLTLPNANFWQQDRRRELRARGENCSAYHAEAQQRLRAERQFDNAIRALSVMGGGSNPAPTNQGSGVVGFLKGETISGTNKICYYDRLGSGYALTIPFTSLCPLTH